MLAKIKVSTGKRWYVEYYMPSPDGKTLERKRAYGGLNKIKNIEERKTALLELKDRVAASVCRGTDFLDKPLYSENTIYKASLSMLAEKRHYLKPEAYKRVKHGMKAWTAFLLEHNLYHRHPSEIRKVDVLNYRNHLLRGKLSNRSVNNNMDEVKALFNFLIALDDGEVTRNPCKNIEDLPFASETHVSYSDKQMQDIMAFLEGKDPQLRLFIRMVAFAYFRTSEAVGIKIKDIDMVERSILLAARSDKTSRRQKKLIQDILYQDLVALNLKQYPGEFFLFGPKGMPGKRMLGKGTFRKRFRRMVKTKFQLSKKHTIYGFRHTTVSMLIRNGARWDLIMKLTGHTTMDAFQKYARSILAMPAEDLSHIYSRGFNSEK